MHMEGRDQRERQYKMNEREQDERGKKERKERNIVAFRS